ncbi:1948_t:CDS:1, partial [Acaulospora colombiana]
IAAANEKLLQNLMDATTDFYNSLALDNSNKINALNNKISDMQNDMKDIAEDLKSFIEIMLLQKGGDDDLTDDAIKDLKINPSFFNEDEEKKMEEVTRYNIRKRIYIGNEVAVKKLQSFELDKEKKKIEKTAKII